VSLLPAGQEPRTHRGRPSLLTQATADRIVAAVEQGSYLKIAAQAAGVGQSTLAGWLARGRQAAAARDAHDPDRRYCPECDTDREDDAATVEQHNAAENARAVEPFRVADDPTPEPRTYAALDRCPTCRTDREPTPWTLPEADAPYVEFLESVTQAQAEAETSAVAAWRSAFTGPEADWRAARDYLARTAPERWAGVTRVQMTTEEAERRIDDAVNEALLAAGVDAVVDDPVDGFLDEGPDT
jgi:hypothetical protein